MYSIDNSISSDSSIKAISVGIQENCYLTKVSYGPSSTKEGAPKALIFEFKQKLEDGSLASFRHLEFAVDQSRETLNAEKYYERLVKAGKTPEDPKPVFIQKYVKSVFTNLSSRVKHIMSKYIPEKDTLITGVTTFEQFSNAVVSKLGNSYVDVKVRLKLIFNSKDYPTFPKYPNFIELQTDAASALKINPKKDRITKQVPDQQEETVDSEY